MNLFRPSALLWVCFVALLAAAAAHAQTQPLDASFAITPAEPVANELVTLTDTTKNPTSAVLEYAWDLDADDQFDDGTSMAMTHAFPAGRHRVSLRVRRIGTVTQTDTATRTIVVREPATPTVTPTPTETATPAPTIHAPKLNLPPRADLARECGPFGPATLCLGPLTKLDTPKTFDASGSKDADGQIVRYQWDLDGNGTWDADTGSSPRLTTTYRDDAPAVLKLRVTDDEGATDETGMALKKLKPGCGPVVTYERVRVTSPCLRRYTIDHGHQYRSEFPVEVNGVTIAPEGGKQVLVNVLGAGLTRRFEIIAGQATATFPFKGQHLRLQRGALRWVLRDHELRNVGSLDGQKLNGLRISGAPETIELPSAGVARTRFLVQLPDAFGAPTSDKPVVITAGAPHAKVASADDAFSFEVPNAAIGPIALDTLKVTYDGDGLWEIDAAVRVPVVDASIRGKAGILNGDFNYAGVEVGFGNPGLGPLGPVYIQRIKFRVEVNPRKSECVPHLGVESGEFLGYKWSYDWGVPTFALCGEIGLTGGPRVLGQSAIALDAGLGLVTFDDRPSVLRAFGNLKVAGIPFADATFEAHTDGFLKVTGDFHYGWDGFASVHGNIALGVLGEKFNAEGGVRACLDFVDFCRGVQALISSKGMAVCMIIDWGLDDWRPGFGYRWGDALPDPYFSGCSLGPYRETIKRTAQAAAVSEQTVTLPAGLPGTVVAATGADAPPKLTLIGPKGERITTPDSLMPVDAKPFFLMKNPNAKLTQIAVSKPAGGRWRVIVEDGSSPVTSLKVAHAVDAPEITAKVSGHGHDRRLAYEVEPRPGQEVTFIERGRSTAGTIGGALGRKGHRSFTPAGGAAERREIVAVVEQDGIVAHQLVVARYRAPGPLERGPVRGLRAKRLAHGTLRVTWKPWARSDRHVVTITLSDGRRIARNVTGRSMVIRRVPRRTRARVTVRAVSASGGVGQAVRLRVR